MLKAIGFSRPKSDGVIRSEDDGHVLSICQAFVPNLDLSRGRHPLHYHHIPVSL